MNRYLCCLILCLCGICLGVTAQPEVRRAAPSSENRFLFILETSGATKRIAEVSQHIVVQLLSNEISGQMKLGDSFSIWTYNETLNAGRFPAQRWNPETRRNTLRQVTNFLGTVKYEKNGRMEVARSAIEAVTKSSPRLTIILVTDGKQQVSGLKFDSEINSLFSDNYNAMRSAKMPFVTILVARRGEFVAFTVNSTLGPIQYPLPPPKAETAEETPRVQPPASTPNEPVAAAASGKEPGPADLPKPLPAPQVSAPEPPKPASAKPPASSLESATPSTQEARPISQAQSLTVPPKIDEAPKPGVIQSVTPPIDARLMKQEKNETTTPTSRQLAGDTVGEKHAEPGVPEDSPASSGTTNEISNASKSLPPERPQPALAVIDPVETSTGRRSLLGTALALVVVAFFLGYLLLRPKRNASLITKSMHRLPK